MNPRAIGILVAVGLVLAVTFGGGYLLGRSDGVEPVELAFADSARVWKERAADDKKRALEIAQAEAEPKIQAALRQADSLAAVVRKGFERRAPVVEHIAERAGPDSAIARAAAQEATDSVVEHEVKPLQAHVGVLTLALEKRTVEYSAALAVVDTQGAALAAADAQIAILKRVKGPSWPQRHQKEIIVGSIILGAIAERKWGP